MYHINIVGAGLAGSEAAYQSAKRGVHVRLFEMKPKKFSPAHKYKGFAELVCSNSLRSDSIENAVGLLKRELEIMDSLIMRAAAETRVPAGGAFAVDRERFSDYITGELEKNSGVEIIHDEFTNIPKDEITIIATGPLTSDALKSEISRLIGGEYLFFFDAAAPIVSRESVDMEKAFFASRYGKGDDDYINCPLTREEYTVFYETLVTAKTAKLHDFDEDFIRANVFEGCMPVEVMAKRGFETLLFGPLKPVGITDPRTGAEPFANIQLRQDNSASSMYNIVGFQTNLTFEEQKRVFSFIPALAGAEYLRHGIMHMNTYINSPQLLSPAYNMVTLKNIFFAGQITGVEGYVESAASGLLAGINAANLALDKPLVILPPYTAQGALAAYISDRGIERFQPMNINYGIIQNPESKIKGGKKAKKIYMAERSSDYLKKINI